MLEALFVLILAALNLAFLGNFIFLRQLALLGDAISHSILLGIVIAYFITPDLTSPWFFILALIAGLLTAALVEALQKLRFMSKDSAIGLVFPFFFSLAVLLISRFARQVHLDVDQVLTGEVLFTPLDRLSLFGYDLPRAAWQLLAVALLNLLFILVAYRPLKLSTFDPTSARLAAFPLFLLNYLLIALLSINLLVAFEAVGSILTISFLVVPAACAYLSVRRLLPMMGLSLGFALINALIAFGLAVHFNLSISGMAAVSLFLIFLMVSLFMRQGLFASCWRRYQQRKIFCRNSLLLHAWQHQDSDRAFEELGLKTLHQHLNWSPKQLDKQLRLLEAAGYLERKDSYYGLSVVGRRVAEDLAKQYHLQAPPASQIASGSYEKKELSS